MGIVQRRRCRYQMRYRSQGALKSDWSLRDCSNEEVIWMSNDSDFCEENTTAVSKWSTIRMARSDAMPKRGHVTKRHAVYRSVAVVFVVPISS